MLPKDVRNSNEKFLRESNALPMFLHSQCVREPKARLKRSEFSRRLNDWLHEENTRWRPPNKQICSMMRHLGFETVKVEGIDHYVGIKLREGDDLMNEFDGEIGENFLDD